MLILRIKREWFDMIKALIKKEEYREIKPYYINRLYKYFVNAGYRVTKDKFLDMLRQGTAEFGKVELINGYAKDSPTMTIYCNLRIGKGNPEWGAEKDKEYFVFGVEEILEI